MLALPQVYCPRCGVIGHRHEVAWKADRGICGVCADREDIGD
jgi:hypothetical protein